MQDKRMPNIPKKNDDDMGCDVRVTCSLFNSLFKLFLFHSLLCCG